MAFDDATGQALELTHIETIHIDPSRFELPAAPMTMDELIAERKQRLENR